MTRNSAEPNETRRATRLRVLSAVAAAGAAAIVGTGLITSTGTADAPPDPLGGKMTDSSGAVKDEFSVFRSADPARLGRTVSGHRSADGDATATRAAAIAKELPRGTSSGAAVRPATTIGAEGTNRRATVYVSASDSGEVCMLIAGVPGIVGEATCSQQFADESFLGPSVTFLPGNRFRVSGVSTDDTSEVTVIDRRGSAKSVKPDANVWSVETGEPIGLEWVTIDGTHPSRALSLPD